MTDHQRRRTLTRWLEPGRRRTVAEGLLSGFVLQGFLLITGVIAARLLGPADRGVLALVWVVALILSQLGGLGLPLAVTNELAIGGVALRTLVRMLGRVIVLQVVGLTFALGAALVVLITVRGIPAGPAAVALAVMPSMVLHNYCVGALQGVGAFRRLHMYRLMPAALYALGLSVGVVIGQSTLLFVTTTWVASYVVSSAFAAAAVRRVARRQRGARPDARTTSPRTLVRFGTAGLVGYVSPTESFRVDQLIVGLLLSVHDLGLYVAALAFCSLPRFLAQGLGLVLYPAVAGAPDVRAQRRLIWRFSAVGTAAAIVVVAPLLVFARPVLELAFGSEFAEAAPATQVLLAGTVVVCARRLIADGLRGAGSPGAGSVAEALSWGWLIPALVLLVPTMGLMGVAVAVASSYVVTTLLLVRAAGRRGLGLRAPVPP